MPELVGHSFPFGRGAFDSWPTISGRPEHSYPWKRCSYGVDAACGSTDGEHEIRKPVQVMDTEMRKVNVTMLVIFEQMSLRFVYSRRMKDLRELEAQHEAIVLECATDGQKFRARSEFSANSWANETRLWSMELSDRQADYLREMHALQIECRLVEFEQQASDEFGDSCDPVVQISQNSLVLFNSRVTSHSIP